MLKNSYYSQDHNGPYEFYELGDFQLESGKILQNARLAYAMHGKINDAKDNVILFTIMFSGTSKNMEHYIGPGKALDPDKFCIILPNQLGAGLSTSPHNVDGPQSMSNFPEISIADDVRAQYKFLTEHLDIQELQLVTVSGALIRSESCSGCTNQAKLDLADLAAGIYFVRVKGKDRMVIKKVVKY